MTLTFNKQQRCIYTHSQQVVNCELSPKLGRDLQEYIYKQLKFTAKDKQKVYSVTSEAAEFEYGLYLVLKPPLHCVLA